jgi:hypothetical protein
MYWVPALVLGMVVVVVSPPLLQWGDHYERDFRGAPTAEALPRRSKVLVGLVSGGLVLGVLAGGAVGLHYAVVAKDEVDGVATAKQYALATWVEEQLSPDDGSVGLFFGGVSYHLPDFEIADFLGKGDELIAALPAKDSGLPGHNKWDIDATLDKWQPQVILPTTVIDVLSDEGRTYAQQWLESGWNHAYLPDLFLSPRVQQDYRLCFVPGPGEVADQEYGLLLRNDIAAQHASGTRCVEWT